MSEPALTAQGVTYRVGDSVLVSDVSLTAGEGELLVIIGPNGAGKSTLVNLLSGALRPSEGLVMLRGVDTATSLPSDLALTRAVLTQRIVVELPFTAGQIVEMGRFPHRLVEGNSADRDARAVASAMERTETTRFSRRIFSTLSGGERTRVSLARVLAQETPIVMLDEPTTALDVAHQERIMQEASTLAKQGRTVVATLHDLNAAAAYAHTVLLMSEGEVAAQGSPREVLEEDRLSEVYGQPMAVVEHPFRDCPLILAKERS